METLPFCLQMMLSYYIVLSEKRKAQKLVLAFVPPTLHNMGISTGKEGSHAAHHRRALRHHRPKIHQKHAPARAVPGWRNSDHRTEPAPLVANRPLCARKARLDRSPAAETIRASRRDKAGILRTVNRSISGANRIRSDWQQLCAEEALCSADRKSFYLSTRRMTHRSGNRF